MTVSRLPNNDGGIQPTILTAKGDLLTATAASTVTNLPAGSNDQVLVADSTTSTGLAWKPYGAPFAAGKNKIINGDFGIWQRGTSFTPTNGSYSADRYYFVFDGTGATRTISQQVFTPGTAPVAGYEGVYFFRYAQTVAGTGNANNLLIQKIENVQTLAGQTATISFWAKADSARTVTTNLYQSFGSGGSGDVSTASQSNSVTTSWQRFTQTVTLGSLTGKTIGTGSFLGLQFALPAGTTPTIDLWGVQVEAGSVATAFQTATGTLQGELQACQRYYQRMTGTVINNNFGVGTRLTTTGLYVPYYLPVQMRTSPTFGVGNQTYFNVNNGLTNTATTAVALDQSSPYIASVTYTTSASTAGTAGNVYVNTAGAYLEFIAEL